MIDFGLSDIVELGFNFVTVILFLIKCLIKYEKKFVFVELVNEINPSGIIHDV